MDSENVEAPEVLTSNELSIDCSLIDIGVSLKRGLALSYHPPIDKEFKDLFIPRSNSLPSGIDPIPDKPIRSYSVSNGNFDKKVVLNDIEMPIPKLHTEIDQAIRNIKPTISSLLCLPIPVESCSELPPGPATWKREALLSAGTPFDEVIQAVPKTIIVKSSGSQENQNGDKKIKRLRSLEILFGDECKFLKNLGLNKLMQSDKRFTRHSQLPDVPAVKKCEMNGVKRMNRKPTVVKPESPKKIEQPLMVQSKLEETKARRLRERKKPKPVAEKQSPEQKSPSPTETVETDLDAPAACNTRFKTAYQENKTRWTPLEYQRRLLLEFDALCVVSLLTQSN
jgi:hypothetical protein